MRVLLISNNAAVYGPIEAMLKHRRCGVDLASFAGDAQHLLQAYGHDVAILDSNVHLDAGGLVRKLRADGVKTPILVVSRLRASALRTDYLWAGADDVVGDATDLDELFARVSALARRSHGHASPELKLGPITLRQGSNAVSAHGRPVRLTRTEYQLLELLISRKGAVVTKSQAMDLLYGGEDEPEIKIIDVFICKLRRKLADAGADGLIGTVWGRGYVASDESIAAPPGDPVGRPVEPTFAGCPMQQHIHDGIGAAA